MGEGMDIDSYLAEAMAQNWDETAKLCDVHHDRTAAAAFRTCANQLRHNAGLPENIPPGGLPTVGGVHRVNQASNTNR